MHTVTSTMDGELIVDAPPPDYTLGPDGKYHRPAVGTFRGTVQTTGS